MTDLSIASLAQFLRSGRDTVIYVILRLSAQIIRTYSLL